MNYKIDIQQSGPNQFLGSLPEAGLYTTGNSKKEILERLNTILTAFERWTQADYVSSDEPIIIGGSNRSGTTLLWKVLNAHPNIACALETNFFCQTPYLLQILPLGPSIKSSNLFIERIAENLMISKDTIQRCAAQTSSLAFFCERFLRTFADCKGKNRWSEKNPNNVFHVDYIRIHFPNMKFVHIVRDGRDVACSSHRHGTPSWEKCAERWNKMTRAALQYRDQPWYKEIQYETLVNNPAAELRALFDFIGEEMDNRLIDTFHTTEQPAYLDDHPFHENLRNPVNTQAVARWKTEMDVEAKTQFKQIAGDLLCELGYVDSNDW